MDIVAELSLAITAWIAQVPTRTCGTLQRRCNVSETALRRIKDREQKHVNMETAMELAYVLFDTDEAIAFIKRHFPVSGRWQEKVYSKRDDVVTLAPYFRNRITNKIILLCETQDGSTIEEIRAEFGSDGVRELSKMVELGVIVVKEEVHQFSPSETPMLPSRSTRFAMIENYLSFFNENNSNIVGACAEFAYQEGLSPESVRRLSRVIRTFEEDVNVIITDPKSKGNIPWFIGLVQNILRGNRL